MSKHFKQHLVYKVGADPELFVQNDEGVFLSAHDLVPGNKFQPYHVDHGAIQPDGVSAEFNIEPALTSAQFRTNMKTVMGELLEEVRAGAVRAGLGHVSLRVVPTAHFDPVYFNRLPQEALAFGCTPDWNAWTEHMTEFIGTNLPFRTGGGHIHVGWTNNASPEDEGHWRDCVNAVKQLDACLFPYSMLWDRDNERRRLYGRLGSFRPKHYGVEYRPLSNAWVADPKLHDYIFKTVIRAMELLDTYDIRFWEHKEAKKMLSKLRQQQPYMLVPGDELLAYHNKTAQDWGLPILPDKYRRKAAAAEATS